MVDCVTLGVDAAGASNNKKKKPNKNGCLFSTLFDMMMEMICRYFLMWKLRKNIRLPPLSYSVPLNLNKCLIFPFYLRMSSKSIGWPFASLYVTRLTTKQKNKTASRKRKKIKKKKGFGGRTCKDILYNRWWHSKIRK